MQIAPHTTGVAMTATLDSHRPTTMTATAAPHSAPAGAVTVTQYSRRQIVAIWAAAALPMGALSWIVAPAVANGSGAGSLIRPLLACMTIGLIWQFLLVVGLVGYEQRSLRWSRVRQALWLRRPRSPRTGIVGGRTWFIIVPLVVVFGLHELLSLPVPLSRDF